MNLFDIFEDASGVIATKKQARDPRYSMSLSKDVRPGEIDRQLKKMSLAESAEPNLKEVGNIFIKHCANDLGLKSLPKIVLVKTIAQSQHPTFGLFDPNTNTIKVAYEGRHIMDVLRTLAHELTHHKQREENRIKPDSGETGSDIENEANAQAGVLMRDFADRNPSLFSSDLQELDEPPVKKSWDDYGQKFAAKVEPKEKVFHSWQHYDDEQKPNVKQDNKTRLPVRN